MKTLKTLKVGDVFALTAGMQAYVTIPEKFVFSNTPDSEQLTTTNVTIGEVRNPNGKKSSLDTAVFVGEYVVEATEFSGGGTAMFNDVYPDGHKVTARKLTNDGKYNRSGRVVSFYQSGCFNAMNRDVPVVRQMKMAFQ